ncbi:hypothetical protein EAE96_001484 [Botrytis aclada]|nr:hypothetical protein EAE96_001484 [Botrytis aclada]
MSTEMRNCSSTNFATTDKNMATTKKPESMSKSFGYVLEMQPPREYMEREYRERQAIRKEERIDLMWLFVVDTANYYSIPEEEVSLEVIRCRYVMNSGPQMFEDCSCKWCAGSPKTGEQDLGMGKGKPGCWRCYLKDSQTPLYP